jgi:hypothetical protein
MSTLDDVKNKILGQIPVIGPHGDIEEKLLLSGQKPLGWISVAPPMVDENHPTVRDHLALQRQLDAAVGSGRLIAKDVTQLTVITRSPNIVERVGDREIPDRETVYRHYAQPGNEKRLAVMSAFNQAAFNRQEIDPSVDVDKDIGDYLGYRKRDQAYWRFTQLHGYKLPLKIQQALIWLNVHVAQPAYKADILRQADDRIAKLPALIPEGSYREECMRRADGGDTGMQMELGTDAWWRRDFAESEKWFRKAALAGDPVGQHNLGVLYQNGDGVPKDHVEAFFWKSLATQSKLNFYKPDGVAASAALLIDGQRAGVQQRLAAWKPVEAAPQLAAKAAAPALPKPSA